MPVNYTVTIHQSELGHASILEYVYVTLIGEKAEHECTLIPSYFSVFKKSDLKCTVSCSEDLGEVVQIKVQKKSQMILKVLGYLKFFSLAKGLWQWSEDWFPSIVEVESDTGKKFSFPIYHWITDDEPHYFREGKAALCFQDNDELKEHRKLEIKQQKNVYHWYQYADDIPYCVMPDGVFLLPLDEQYSVSRDIEAGYTLTSATIQLKLEQWILCKDEFTSIKDIKSLYDHHTTDVSGYVFEHWKDDDFFGYQFLNGINPLLIRQCKALPENFAVSSDVVPMEEAKEGNFFLCDYKILDGVETNIINNKKQYLAAPLVLLRLDDGKMKPIAIQLKQLPGEDNPVFYPNDGYDWLLAKIFVRSADFNLHELNSHLLRTHLLAEVFAVSLRRNLPMVHPVYKLLIPHIQYTMFINTLARRLLISEDGVFTKFAASGGDGMMTIMKRSLETMTYSSLCIKDDIEDRKLKDVPNFYYKEDGEQLWDIIHSFVAEMLDFYYENDDQVKRDSEVQDWISDIFKHGFLYNKKSGIPEKFESRAELVKFVTMVMYTCSAQHSAVNTGQYDFYGWMPNAPSTLQLPPPTEKGKATEETILAAFPNIETTVNTMSTVWLLSKKFSDAIHLGIYPDKRFTEERCIKKIKNFKRQLDDLSTKIQGRQNLKYTYLDPGRMENSVSI
ncbi:polyunsaturated fatty acid lipoxygenase ALOX15B-like [Xenentodon cancila]